MLRRTYDWMMRLAGSSHAGAGLAAMAFAEGVFFPIPPDVMLMPMVLARRELAWRYAAICVSASVLGGSVGYAVGYFLHPVGQWILRITGVSDGGVAFQHWYAQWGVLLLAVPIPYKLSAIASGLFELNFLTFIAASVFIRGLRFFLVAGLMKRYGPPVQAFVEKRLALVVSGVAVLLIGLIVLIKVVG
ncbi:MAG TPA: YqaA family protein [Caulobacteraceae bacterium]|nr:YqaA family protein [Caulobacteraceae bacterium]